MNNFNGLVFNVRTKHSPREENMVSFPWICNWLSSFHDRHDFEIKPAVIFNIYTLWQMTTYHVDCGSFLKTVRFDTDDIAHVNVDGYKTSIEGILKLIDTDDRMSPNVKYLVNDSLGLSFSYLLVDSGILLRVSKQYRSWDEIYYYGNLSEELRWSPLLSDIAKNSGWRICTDPTILNDLKVVQALNKLPEPKVEKDMFTEEQLTKALEQLTLDFGKNGISRAGLSNIINNASEVIKIANVMLAKDFYDLD